MVYERSFPYRYWITAGTMMQTQYEELTRTRIEKYFEMCTWVRRRDFVVRRRELRVFVSDLKSSASGSWLLLRSPIEKTFQSGGRVERENGEDVLLFGPRQTEKASSPSALLEVRKARSSRVRHQSPNSWAISAQRLTMFFYLFQFILNRKHIGDDN